MKHILRDLHESSIIRAIEYNLIEMLHTYGRMDNIDLQQTEDFVPYITHVAHPFCNGVAYANLDESSLQDVIKHTKAYFMQHHLPFRWWVTPSTRPRNIGAYLQAAGFSKRSDFSGMAAPIAALKEPFTSPEELSIVRVTGNSMLQQWFYTMRSGFYPSQPERFPESLLRMLQASGTEYPFSYYLAFSNARPVATSALFRGAGVAGLYWVSTLPEFRGRGIGKRMVLKAMRDAQKEGFVIGVLHASDAGETIYRDLGFKKYCTIERYQ